MNDQKFNGGVAAPLFGVMAHTAPGPASFALRFGIPIQPMSVQRIHKARFRVIVHEPILLEDTGDRDADIEAGVRRINAFIEERVRDAARRVVLGAQTLAERDLQAARPRRVRSLSSAAGPRRGRRRPPAAAALQ